MALQDLLGRKSTPTGPAPLNDTERQLLTDAETIIGRHVLSYTQVGKALGIIRDKQLYREKFATFEDYVSEKWKMDRAHAYRLIQAAEVARNLSPTGDVPSSERQARPLTRLDPPEQVSAWQEAKAAAGEGPVTAGHVEAAAAKRRPKKKTARKPKPIRLRVPGGTVIIEPNKAFTSAAEILRHALAQVERQAAA